MKTVCLEFNTKGNTDIINITDKLQELVIQEEIVDGIIFLNVIGSTAGLTTMEYESGLIKDMHYIFDKLLPYRKDYAHNFTWSDDNGHSHLRSSFIKTNFFVTVTNAKLDLGTWQQVVLIDFDTQPRRRKIIAKILI